MAGDESVAGHQDAVNHIRAVPGGMSGRGQRHRPTRQGCGDLGGQRPDSGYACAHQSALAGDSRRPPQPRRPPGLGHQRGRRRLLEVVPLGMGHFCGMAIHRCAVGFGEPDRGSEVIDVGVRQQDRTHVGRREAEATQGCQHIVTTARKASVDQQYSRTVGHDRPVDQLGLHQMHGRGNGGQHRGHVRSVFRLGVETWVWLN